MRVSQFLGDKNNSNAKNFTSKLVMDDVVLKNFNSLLCDTYLGSFEEPAIRDMLFGQSVFDTAKIRKDFSFAVERFTDLISSGTIELMPSEKKEAAYVFYRDEKGRLYDDVKNEDTLFYYSQMLPTAKDSRSYLGNLLSLCNKVSKQLESVYGKSDSNPFYNLVNKY